MSRVEIASPNAGDAAQEFPISVAGASMPTVLTGAGGTLLDGDGILSATRIRFAIRDAGFTTLKVFNLLGEEVAKLVDRDMQPER